MRLLRYDDTGGLRLLSFFGRNIPPYAILSHTWGPDSEEVTYKDLTNGTVNSKFGYIKIRFCGEQARRDGLQFFWVDTCCIDKSISAELAEAINSMFQWYRNAAKCYVYLADFSTLSFDKYGKGRLLSDRVYYKDFQTSSFDNAENPSWKAAFRRSRWFTRGWTLQELIAPTNVDFYSREWELIGPRSELVDDISEITGIDTFALVGGDLRKVSVARRMYWASGRMTTRVEDQAYCLMGLFDVNMAIIYGEGEQAFKRLQQEILKSTNDPSIFAWQWDVDWRGLTGIWERPGMPMREIYRLLARAPAEFARCGVAFPPLMVERTRENDDDLEDGSLWDSMSTTSTLVQSSVDEPANPALSHAIAFLKNDPELFRLFQAAMERPSVGVDRFRRVLVNVLRYLAVELAQEAENKDQKSSAIFIRRYRLLIGSAVTASVAERTLKPIELELGLSENQPEAVAADEDTLDETLDRAGEDAEDAEDAKEAEDAIEVNVQFQSTAAFIRSSEAFRLMVERLTDLAYPSFRSLATGRLEKWLKRKRGELDVEHLDAVRSKMLLIISELHYSRPESLLIDIQGELSHFERFQLKLESLTGEEWDWWPWRRPRPKLGLGESWLGWTCSCRDARWEAVPTELAQRLASLARTFPLTSISPLPVPPPPTWNPSKATASTAKGSASAAPPTAPDGGPAGSTSSPSTFSALTAQQQTTSQESIPIYKARFIFLVAKFGRYMLDELPSLHLDTVDFGSELRSAYLRRKGFWLSWLSLYGFSHCDFVKFEKYNRNSYAHRGYGLPDLKLEHYYYVPTRWEPPISPEEFKDIFQYVARRQQPRWAVLPLYNADDDDLAKDTVDRIPQRFWNFNRGGKEREYFWGIYVRERRSALMVGVYIMVSLAPFIGFCVLYSLGIIRGDIQDATTPLPLSLTALGLFLGSMIKQ